jgi:hypothetical protein
MDKKDIKRAIEVKRFNKITQVKMIDGCKGCIYKTARTCTASEHRYQNCISSGMIYIKQ